MTDRSHPNFAPDPSTVPAARPADAAPPAGPLRGGPQYKILQRSYLLVVGANGPREVAPGEIVEFAGRPGLNMLPLNDVAWDEKRKTIRNIHHEHGVASTPAAVAAARGLGWTGTNSDEARRFIKDFMESGK